MKKSLMILLIFLVSITGCSKKEKIEKSVDQLRQEQGIPVKVETVKQDTLKLWSTYYTPVTGENEINVVPFVGDRLVKIFVKEGQYVKKGQILAQFMKDNPATITARQAKIQYNTIKKTYERMRNVYEKGGISKQQLDEVEMQYKIAKEAYISTSKMLNVVAPMSGIVTDIFADKYKILDPKKDAICKIATIKTLKAKIFLDESDISKYKKGQKVEVTWKGLPNEKFVGKITEIAYSSTPQAHGFAATIIINNKSRKLMPGINVDLKINTVYKPGVIIVPQNVIIDNGDKKFVYVANGSVAQKREIKVGEISSTNIEVVNGLSAGDKLIVEGATMLSDGSKIKVVK